MKVRSSVKPMCDKCKVIRRKGVRARLVFEPQAQTAARLRREYRRTRMARIAGVDIPNDKNVNIALTYIYGIGRTSANKIAEEAKIDAFSKVKDLTEAEVQALREIIERGLCGGGRLEEQGDDEHQAVDGHRHLSGASASPRSARSRAKNPYERAYAQGAAQDGGRKEERHLIS